jgi:hypothetical protein
VRPPCALCDNAPHYCPASRNTVDEQTVYYPLQPEYVETALRNGQVTPSLGSLGSRVIARRPCLRVGLGRGVGTTHASVFKYRRFLSEYELTLTGSCLKVVMPGDKLADGSVQTQLSL